MARTDTLGNFLTDVADAIRTKKGTSETIPAEDFDTEIENLPSGGGDYNVKVDTSKSYSGGLSSLITEIGNIDASEMTSMKSFFSGCINLKTSPALDTSSVTNMNSMFRTCRAMTSIPLLNTSNVTDMSYMFNGCSQLTTVPQLNTSKVENMTSMFDSCTSLTTVSISDVSSLKNTLNMFNGCTSLGSVTFNSIDVCSPTNMGNTFNSCRVLRYIDMRNFDFSNVTSYSNMFGISTQLGVPDDCEIIVADDTQKTWITSKFTRLTNVKTVAEYEAEQNA